MSKLTLEKAISHCLEVAEKNETQADKIGRQFIGSIMDKRATDCRECAAEHRQLAEWLTELKELEAKHWDECRQIAHYDNDIKSLKAQIADLKRCVKSLNSDYLTGYISALSAVEGMIDKMLGV